MKDQRNKRWDDFKSYIDEDPPGIDENTKRFFEEFKSNHENLAVRGLITRGLLPRIAIFWKEESLSRFRHSNVNNALDNGLSYDQVLALDADGYKQLIRDRVHIFVSVIPLQELLQLSDFELDELVRDRQIRVAILEKRLPYQRALVMDAEERRHIIQSERNLEATRQQFINELKEKKIWVESPGSIRASYEDLLKVYGNKTLVHAMRNHDIAFLKASQLSKEVYLMLENVRMETAVCDNIVNIQHVIEIIRKEPSISIEKLEEQLFSNVMEIDFDSSSSMNRGMRN